MRDMLRRIEALERKKGTNRPSRWHRVIVDGQSEAAALAAHEAQHGPIGKDGVVYRVIVNPAHAQQGMTVQ